MLNNSPSAQTLLARGDTLAILGGKLVITSASGKPVPKEWLEANKKKLILEVLERTQLDAFVYDSYSTGRYGKQNFCGVCLQFISLLSDKNPYAIFNAELDRVKDTSKGKKGSPLPTGQFRVGKRSSFYKFWAGLGLKTPPRLSSFHDYMGNLKSIVFTARFSEDEKLEKQTIQALNLTHRQILAAFKTESNTDKQHTTSTQQPDKPNTSLPYKNCRVGHDTYDFQALSTTGDSNYGTRLQGSADTRGNVIPITTVNNPEEQSTNEWLMDYGND